MVVVARVVAGAVVVACCRRKESVPTSNTVTLHGVLYWLHCLLGALYEILAHSELAMHACWHASKLDCCPEDWVSCTSPLATLQMPLVPVCLHECPMAMKDANMALIRTKVRVHS